MSEKNNPSNGELTISRNSSLAMKKSNDIASIQPRILFVDDDEAVRNTLSEYFKNEGYETYTASLSEEAFEILSKKPIDVVITDVLRPGISGLEFTKLVKEKYDTEVIITTGYKEGCSYEKARRLGAFELFYKPFRLTALLNSVKKVLKKGLPTSQGSKQF